MKTDKNYITIVLVVFVIGLLVMLLLFNNVFIQKYTDIEVLTTTLQEESSRDTSTTVEAETNIIVEKTIEEKQKVMDSDLSVMNTYGLYYDYVNLSLVETIKVFLDEFGLDYSSLAVSYKDVNTNETVGFNELQPMRAGSTYKLPLSMLVTDGVLASQFSLDDEYDITNLDYENENEYSAYRRAFGDSMTIPQMQRYALVYSENTPAYAMAKLLGGFDTAYSLFERYGKSKNVDLPTFAEGNMTTADYYIQVLDYLFKNSEKYADILNYLEESFDTDYLKEYLGHLKIQQKPGFIADTLNIAGIVHEETPYFVAIYTLGWGGPMTETGEVNLVGYYHLTRLCYVINEWHRVNKNP